MRNYCVVYKERSAELEIYKKEITYSEGMNTENKLAHEGFQIVILPLYSANLILLMFCEFGLLVTI